MSAEQSTTNVQLLNSCLVGSQWYRIVEDGQPEEDRLIEEIFNKIRQTSGVPYIPVQGSCGSPLWLSYFQIPEVQLDQLLATMEYVQANCLGEPNMVFPEDIVFGNESFGLMLRPIDRESTKPIRCFTPCEDGPRWKIALALFRRVQRLHSMGLTSNGISRTQLRCDPATGEVTLWLNHTLSLVDEDELVEVTDTSDRFFSVPDFTVKVCAEKDMPVRGRQRDIFSAALAAFYLLMHTHPFIGSDFVGRLRSDYSSHYQTEPKYIFEPHTSNRPGTMILDTMTVMQWEQTVPQLTKLFDQIFMAVTRPESHWSNDLECWDPQQWIDALSLDQDKNINASGTIPQAFTREWQRLV